jgi:hypothetical protein
MKSVRANFDARASARKPMIINDVHVRLLSTVSSDKLTNKDSLSEEVGITSTLRCYRASAIQLVG